MRTRRRRQPGFLAPYTRCAARTGRNLDHPPAHGPGGEPAYQFRPDAPAESRWHVPLNAVGQAFADEFLRQYPQPWVLLKTTQGGRFAWLYRRYFEADGAGWREAEAAECAARLGVTTAAGRFDPATGNRFVTYAANCVCTAVANWHKTESRQSQRTTILSDERAMALAAPEDDTRHPDAAAKVAEVFALLDEEEALVLGLLYRDHLSLADAGRELRLSGRRVAAIRDRAFAKARGEEEG